VTVAFIHVLTLNRSRTHTLCCAAGRVHTRSVVQQAHLYVVNPWEKGNAHGLEFDVMV
jgi:hypothetical protein